MKKNILLSFLLFILVNCSLGQTQSEMTKQSGDEAKNTNNKLNLIYKQILKTYSKDTLFIRNLKASQKAWSYYRNSQIKTKFPDYSNHHYGSMLSMCVTKYSKQLTEKRIIELEAWLIGSEQGDCQSSIKFTDELPNYNSSTQKNK